MALGAYPGRRTTPAHGEWEELRSTLVCPSWDLCESQGYHVHQWEQSGPKQSRLLTRMGEMNPRHQW